MLLRERGFRMTFKGQIEMYSLCLCTLDTLYPHLVENLPLGLEKGKKIILDKIKSNFYISTIKKCMSPELVIMPNQIV